MSEAVKLKIIRTQSRIDADHRARKANLPAETILWCGLVENSTDTELIHIVRECTVFELSSLARAAIFLSRSQFLCWWFNRPALPQVSLEFPETVFTEFSDPKTSTKTIVTIITSKRFRKLYPKMLTIKTNEDSSSEDLVLEATRNFFIRTIPLHRNGLSILWKEWKKYPHNSQLWQEIPLTKIIKNLSIADLKAVLSSGMWQSHHLHFVAKIIANNDNNTFRYLMEWVWSFNKATDQFPEPARSIIRRESGIPALFSATEITNGFSNGKIRRLPWRVKMLEWLIPQTNVKKMLAGTVDKDILYKMDPRLIHNNFYYYFCNKRSGKPATPEDLLWIEKQKPFITPAIVNRTKFIGVLNRKNYQPTPEHYIYDSVIGNQILIDSIKMVIVKDVNTLGTFKQRIEYLGTKHEYWNGPYATLAEEMSDLQIFVDLAKEKGWTRIWWPRGVYVANDLLSTVSKPPDTIYDNYGWEIVGNTGLILYVHPREKGYAAFCYYKGVLHSYRQEIKIPFDMSTTPPPKPKNVLVQTLRDLSEECISIIKSHYNPLIAIKDHLEIFAMNIKTVLNKSWFQPVYNYLKDHKKHPHLTRYKWIVSKKCIRPVGWICQYSGKPIYDGVWLCHHNGIDWVPETFNYDSKAVANSNKFIKAVETRMRDRWLPTDLVKYRNNDYNPTQIRKRPRLKQDIITDSICGTIAGPTTPYCYYESYNSDPYVVAEDNYFRETRKEWIDPITLQPPIPNDTFKKLTTVIEIADTQTILASKKVWEEFKNNITESCVAVIFTVIDTRKFFAESQKSNIAGHSIIEWHSKGWDPELLVGTANFQWLAKPLQQFVFPTVDFFTNELGKKWKLSNSTGTADRFIKLRFDRINRGLG